MADNSQVPPIGKRPAGAKADLVMLGAPSAPGRASRLDRWWLGALLVEHELQSCRRLADAGRGEQLDAAARSTLMRALDAADRGAMAS